PQLAENRCAGQVSSRTQAEQSRDRLAAQASSARARGARKTHGREGRAPSFSQLVHPTLAQKAQWPPPGPSERRSPSRLDILRSVYLATSSAWRPSTPACRYLAVERTA